MRKIVTLILAVASISGFSQVKQDTTKKLNEVIIRPYFSSQPLIRSTGAVGSISLNNITLQSPGSLVPAMNTIPGVRMEERSPGSYRLSLRGSLLRSPFGIRNVKIYFDDFPLTDAGGNTYLNAIDIAAAGSIDVLKGPQSSIYGANSGGVVLIHPQVAGTDSTRIDLNLSGGSFGLFRENIALAKQWKKYQLSIVQSYQRSDGYRYNSAMERKYIQVNQKWEYAKNASLQALAFYSDLFYELPGGLNAAQFAANPKAARPAAGAIKGAVEQHSSIYTKTVFGGVTNNWQISPAFKHVISVFATHTDFESPFITNYEFRKESTIGVRTYVEYEKNTDQVNWKFNLGLESSSTSTDDKNYDNNLGTPANPQAFDKLRAGANFGFANLNIDISRKLLLELSASGNLYGYHYKSSYPVVVAEQKKSFDLQFMPRAALSYLFTPDFSARASVSKGYSPPTLAEIRSSDNVINTDLQPEKGWNYETGLRYQLAQNRISIDLTGFYYHLNNAIVRRLNENGTEYFINAGGTKQLGIETSLSAWIIAQNSTKFIRGLLLSNAYTLSHFKFDDYFNGTTNLSDKDLTGVPRSVVVTGVQILLPKGLYVFMQHNYTAKLPLTDANTVYAAKYHLVQAKIGWKDIKIGKTNFEIYGGADNILDQKYSLGNDLNAAGARYYNAAASRNFYGGLAAHF
ncbi:iron complex outermembrane recepter protein [Pedobacter westerhofensis]|uniref:Iron complex outermembrane recepter protein n=1 Tax=Pedobacter westerhofensis TaxID=425512 RepID=A0A521DB80_9SPHI|nr:TonB-dependent receptor [Pedobacter westerhofensis]SMO68979.1 iron complex outermembrane recepter protein [Pedobacter westerhofensis]